MKISVSRVRVKLQRFRGFLAILLALLLVPVEAVAFVPQEQKSPASVEKPDVKIPNDQLDSLVAPIALYPDQLLSQVLVASTYPLEIVQLQQWLAKNPKLKDKALADAVAKQPWDPSIQSMAALPDVVKRLADDIQWTTDLGNAFLAQQSDVMDSVQRMRKKAQDKGALKSSEQMKVETQVIENKSVIVVQQSNPEVVYVPSYDPVVVYGAPVYPYPPIYYPPYYGTGAVVAASMISFGVGMAIGAAWGGGWGYGCGWGNNNINVNMNNNFQRNNINNINNIGSGNRGGNNWQHNPQHRGGTPYANKGTADRFGGSTRGASASTRQTGARQQLSRQGGNVSNRAGVSDRSGGGLGGGAGVSDRSGGGLGGGAGVSNRASGTSGSSVGNRSVSPRSSGSSSFGGGGGGLSGSSARSSSSRGSMSMGGRSGGGRSGGGGGRRR
jgi:hypothetical protein